MRTHSQPAGGALMFKIQPGASARQALPLLALPSALADTSTDYNGKEKGDYSPQVVLGHCAAGKEYLKSRKVSQWHKAIHGAIVQIFDRLLNGSNFRRLEAGQISGHRLHQFLGPKELPQFYCELDISFLKLIGLAGGNTNVVVHPPSSAAP
ncbi:hypothetical protein B0H17DRAFT_1128492 [Mycena rosella]|uniref:Uncharacterized protein n=1 Tax=Mycena rosella TaxID=1033263 RepID=A0AAD7DX22_MYCRO|nr:hypothetical protein B0H17DRAFT_1128492 [Mycena rosella]